MEYKDYQKSLDELKNLDPTNFSTKEEYQNTLKEKTNDLQQAVDELNLFLKEEQAVEIVLIKDAVGQRIYQCPHCRTMLGVDLDKIHLLTHRYCTWCGKKLSSSEVESND